MNYRKSEEQIYRNLENIKYECYFRVDKSFFN